MGHFSVEIYALPGSLLSSNQQPRAKENSNRTEASRKKRRSTSSSLLKELGSSTSVTGTPRAEAAEKNVRILVEVSSARSNTVGNKTEMLSPLRSEEHTSELQSLMRISSAVFCLQK